MAGNVISKVSQAWRQWSAGHNRCLGPGWLPGGDLFYSTRCIVSWNFRSVMTASCQGPVNRFKGSNDWEQRSPGLEHRGRLLLPSPWSLVPGLQTTDPDLWTCLQDGYRNLKAQDNRHRGMGIQRGPYPSQSCPSQLLHGGWLCNTPNRADPSPQY